MLNIFRTWNYIHKTKKKHQDKKRVEITGLFDMLYNQG